MLDFIVWAILIPTIISAAFLLIRKLAVDVRVARTNAAIYCMTQGDQRPVEMLVKAHLRPVRIKGSTDHGQMVWEVDVEVMQDEQPRRIWVGYHNDLQQAVESALLFRNQVTNQ